jgi:hypothetical protein
LKTAGCAAVGVAVICALWWIFREQPDHHPTYVQISEGMTKAEVVTLLGSPITSRSGRIPPGDNWIELDAWEFPDCKIEVMFRIWLKSNVDGIIVEKWYLPKGKSHAEWEKWKWPPNES